MQLDRLRSLALTLALVSAPSLNAQAPEPKPAQSPTEAKAAPATKALPKAGPKTSKTKAKPKPQDDAQVKPEVAIGSQVRSKRLKEQKKAEAGPKLPPVNVNTASREELMALPGITSELANQIIAKRPYNTKSRVVLSGAIPYAVYIPLKKRLTVSGK